MNEFYIGATVELKEPWRGYRSATIIDDLGNRLLVEVSSGAEIEVYEDEIILT